MYNFTLSVKISNNNNTDVFLSQMNIGIFYDANKYTTIASYSITNIYLPAQEATIYPVEGYVALVDDAVPQRVFVSVYGWYSYGGDLIKIDFGMWIDLSAYWP